MSIQGHSHEERWRLCSTLPRSAYDKADDIRAMLRVAKASLLAIGARSLTPVGVSDQHKVVEIAKQLSDQCNVSEMRLDPHGESQQLRPLLHQVVNGVRQLDVWAQAIIDSNGLLTAESAAGLRRSYSDLRSAANSFWELELVPEGRT